MLMKRCGAGVEQFHAKVDRLERRIVKNDLGVLVK